MFTGTFCSDEDMHGATNHIKCEDLSPTKAKIFIYSCAITLNLYFNSHGRLEHATFNNTIFGSFFLLH